MNRLTLLAIAICCSAHAAASGEDYLLRLETVGYVDRPESEKEPQEKVLQSIEVLARPNSAFHGKVVTGPQTLSMSGELRRQDDGGLRVQIRFVDSVFQGDTIAVEGGGRKPIPNVTAVETSVTVSAGKPIALGELLTDKSSKTGGSRLQSKQRQVLTLIKYDPACG